jgi:hypothetical protein
MITGNHDPEAEAMTDDTTSRFTGDVPAGYHEYLGPILFESYADLVADRVAALGPRRILETAAGTGIVTSRIANRHVAWERFVATDLNAAMQKDLDEREKAGQKRGKLVTSDGLHLDLWIAATYQGTPADLTRELECTLGSRLDHGNVVVKTSPCRH